MTIDEMKAAADEVERLLHAAVDGADVVRAIAKLRELLAACAETKRTRFVRLPLACGGHENGPRPCPYTTCKFNLDQPLEKRGRPAGSLPTRDESQTCALDVADQGGHTLEEVGAVMGVTRERIRQIEDKAIRKLRVRAVRFDLDLDSIIHEPRHALDVAKRPGKDPVKVREAQERYIARKKAAGNA